MSLSHILTPEWLQARYLQQIPCKDRQGKAFPRSLYLTPIYAAIDGLQKAVGIDLTGHADAVCDIRLDSLNWHSEMWYLNDLPWRPIAKMRAFKIQYGNFDPAEIDLSWFVLRDRFNAQFNIMLGPGAFQLPALQTPIGYTTGLGTGRVLDVGRLRFYYTSGFVLNLPAMATVEEGTTEVTLTPTTPATGEVATDVVSFLKPGHYVRFGSDKNVYLVVWVDATSLTLDAPVTTTHTNVTLQGYTYDPVLYETAAMMASIPIMEVIGTFLYGAPAVSGKSLSLDAMSQGKSYAVAPGKGPFAALKATYQEAIEKNLAALMRTYDRIRVFTV